MDLISQSELARRVGLTRQAIAKAIKVGRVDIYGEGAQAKVDFFGDATQEFIRIVHSRNKGKPKGAKKKASKSKAKGSAKTKSKDVPAKPDILTDEELGLKLRLSANSLTRLEAERLKAIEQVHSLVIKNEESRLKLVSRKSVEMVFGQIYAIENNQLKSIPANSCADLAALCGTDSAEVIMSLEEYLDKKIFSVLKVMKKTLDDYLISKGAGGISDATK